MRARVVVQVKRLGGLGRGKDGEAAIEGVAREDAVEIDDGPNRDVLDGGAVGEERLAVVRRVDVVEREFVLGVTVRLGR